MSMLETSRILHGDDDDDDDEKRDDDGDDAHIPLLPILPMWLCRDAAAAAVVAGLAEKGSMLSLEKNKDDDPRTRPCLLLCGSVRALRKHWGR